MLPTRSQTESRVQWDPTPSRPPLSVRVENERAFGGLGVRVKEGADAIHAKLGRVPMDQLLGKVRNLSATALSI